MTADSNGKADGESFGVGPEPEAAAEDLRYEQRFIIIVVLICLAVVGLVVLTAGVTGTDALMLLIGLGAAFLLVGLRFFVKRKKK